MRLYSYIKNNAQLTKKEVFDYQSNGRIKVNGIITNLSHIIKANEIVTLDDIELKELEYNYYIYNKPIGYICTNDLNNPKSLFNHLIFNKKIHTVGRLDKDTHGLIILTNDGKFTNYILNKNNLIEKEYIVVLKYDVNDEFIKKISSITTINNKNIDKPIVKIINHNTISIIIHEGIYHEVRELVKLSNNKVIDLQRVRIGNIKLNDLEIDKFIEIKNIKELI